jgi:nucleoside-diphosphate-sugar epimerase
MIASLAGKRIFVTGATGFIGGAVARRLHAIGAHVLALARDPARGERLAQLGIEIMHGDVTDAARMQAILAQDVQVVMHIAAWLGGRDTRLAETVNVQATRDLAERSAVLGVERFVFTSSVSVYGPMGDSDVDESAALRPYGDPYGDSKIRAEAALREVGTRTSLPIVIVRPGMVYGPESPGWTVRVALWARADRIPLVGSGRGSAFPIYIDDLVDLLLLCAVHPHAAGETFNAVNNSPVTLADFLTGYMRMIPTTRAIRLPCWAAKAAAVVADPFVRRYNLRYVVTQMCGRGQISSQKASDRLGWAPRVTLEEGLRRSEEWLRSEGIL